MVEVTVNVGALLDLIAGAFEQAGQDVLDQVRLREKHVTGRLANSYHLSAPQDDGHEWTIYVESDEVYAKPVERGAWLRGRRGPHMKGNTLVRRTVNAVYGQAMSTVLPRGLKAKRRWFRAPPVVHL